VIDPSIAPSSARIAVAKRGRDAIVEGMTDAPLVKPSHLRPADPSRRAWLARRPAGAIAAALGAIAFVVAAVAQPEVWATPDHRLTVPGLAATAIAALISLARRERAYPLWLVGLGLATAALALGWFLMLAIVIGATVVAIVILHTVL
jgi:hypothetical protein